MAPGFDYADYETGDRNELIGRYPTVADFIERLTLRR
jgi:predicted cupin superfamily sugar epimerase